MDRDSKFHPCRLLTALLAFALAAVGGPLAAQALTPGFTFQGELRLSSGPASGNFDMQFRLYDAEAGGSQIGATVTAGNLAVAGGLFSVQLDFGPAQFAGDRQWLEIAIRPAGSGSYETLSPRTEVTAAPYAWSAAVALANSVTTTSIVDGTIGATDIDATQIQRRVSGSCAAGQYLRVVAQDGSVTCGTDANSGGTVTSIATGAGLSGGPITTAGTIAVAAGGIGTTQIDPTQVQRRVAGSCPVGQYIRVVAEDGSVVCESDAIGTPGWGLSGNAGTNPAANFLGTSDSQPLELRTANARSLRIEPSNVVSGSPPVPITASIIAGSQANFFGGNVRGGTISGGGVPEGEIDPEFAAPQGPNRVTDHYGTVGGGYNNVAGDEDPLTFNSPHATVGGGNSNGARAPNSTVGGGFGNLADRTASTVAGGRSNVASGLASAIGGGEDNRSSGTGAVIAGGSGNIAGAQHAAVGGGQGNVAQGVYSAVSGGFSNCAGGNSSWAGGNRAKIRPATIPSGTHGCTGVPSLPGGPGDAGTFVWADSQNLDFLSTGRNQFLVRADGGFGFNTNTIPSGIEAVLQGRTGANANVDLYLKPAAHGRGINLAMLPGAGAAAFYISQYDGTSFVDRILLASNGDFSVTAQAFKPGGGSWSVPSDARLKTDVAALAGSLDRLLALRGVEYAYRPEATPKSMYLPGRQVGFIAQDVERVFPDWVSETDAGYKIVGPRGFEALTVEALRELRSESAVIDAAQSQRIAALEADNAALRADLAELRALLHGSPVER